MNCNIREAVEVFSDAKNPAFNNHRFCEIGSTYGDNINREGDKLWLWNHALRWWEIRKGDSVEFYDMLAENPEIPPWDEIEEVLEHPVGDLVQVADITSQQYVDPNDFSHIMTWGASKREIMGIGTQNGGYIAQTFHPTASGHEAMARIIIEQLKRDFKGGHTEQPWDPDNCPTGRDCSATVPVCS